MGHRGILSRARGQVRRKRGGKGTLSYLEALLKDPCVYCFRFGCDSIDHIQPKADGGKDHWTNYAPCHQLCNMNRDRKGVIYGIVG